MCTLKLDEECQKWGIKIKIEKTEYMVAGNMNKDLLLASGVVRGAIQTL